MVKMIKREEFSILNNDHRIVGWIRREEERTETMMPLVIFMHGALLDKDSRPLAALTDLLTGKGAAVLSFDFFGHGESGGDLEDMTIDHWLSDIEAVLAYARSLPWVSEIAFAAHSQGALAASLAAGRHPDEVRAMVLYAPAAVIADIGRTGRMPNGSFDPARIPDRIPFFNRTIKGEYFRRAGRLRVYETAKNYRGPVCIFQGTGDRLVPVRYARRYQEVYEDAKLVLYEDEDHMFHAHRDEAAGIAAGFLLKNI